jgi:hypothetical protein
VTLAQIKGIDGNYNDRSEVRDVKVSGQENAGSSILLQTELKSEDASQNGNAIKMELALTPWGNEGYLTAALFYGVGNSASTKVMMNFKPSELDGVKAPSVQVELFDFEKSHPNFKSKTASGKLFTPEHIFLSCKFQKSEK